MTAITTVPRPADLDGKTLLEQAERSYRFGKFSDAFRDCKLALEKGEVANWKDKKKHDAIKSFIRYGHYASGYADCRDAVLTIAHPSRLLSNLCRKSEVLKWLQTRKGSLSDYPLYVCEWYAFLSQVICDRGSCLLRHTGEPGHWCRVATEMSTVSKKHLQYARNDTIKESDKALRDLIDAPPSPGNGKAADMCMEVLIQRVMIPHERFKDAEEVIRDFSSKVSAQCRTVRHSAPARAWPNTLLTCTRQLCNLQT